MYRLKNYVFPASLEEAYTLNQRPRNILLGGGLWLRMGRKSYDTAIDLGALGLDTVEEREDAFSIGCMAPLRQLELHPGLHRAFQGAFREALRPLVGIQLRNMATVGGSVYSRFGFSDVTTLLLALDARVELFAGGVLSLSRYMELPRDRDILVRVVLPKAPGRFTYLSHRRSASDLPVLTLALSRTEASLRAAVGARPGRAVLLEAPMAHGFSPAVSVIREKLAAVPFGSNLRGSAEYRRALAEILLKRGFSRLGGDARWS